MIIELKDQDLREIIKVTIKEEVQLLAKSLLARPDIRRLIWDFTRGQFSSALLTEAGLPTVTVNAIAAQAKKESQAPSGPAGGASTEDGGDGKSGGGGGANTSEDGDGKSGGGGKASKVAAATTKKAETPTKAKPAPTKVAAK